ncbi:MAG: Rieske 2Fe-2S domain-containing protein [Ferruginibacter sp.]
MYGSEWIKLADSTEAIFPLGQTLVTITVEGRQVCMARNNGNLYALSATCPHAGTLMAGGYIDALENIVCPRHFYKFQLATGRNVTGEGYTLKTYQLEHRPDGLFILLPKASINNS